MNQPLTIDAAPADRHLPLSAQSVRMLRENIGWTQDMLARYLGLDRSSISRMENGQPISGPVKRLLHILCDAADKGTVEQLLPDIAEAAE